MSSELNSNLQKLIPFESLESDVILKIAAQINKDNELSGSGLLFDYQSISDFSSLIVETSKLMNRLINAAGSSLMSFLYRMDIPESKVASALATYKTVDSSQVIAVLVIIRANQKIELKKRFS